jgi:hypothetical protein
MITLQQRSLCNNLNLTQFQRGERAF